MANFNLALRPFFSSIPFSQPFAYFAPLTFNVEKSFQSLLCDLGYQGNNKDTSMYDDSYSVEPYLLDDRPPGNRLLGVCRG